MSAQRLIAFLALVGQPALRSHVAGTFWPDVGEERAMANLRTVIWRLGPTATTLLVSEGGVLGLHDTVEVDVRALMNAALEVLENREPSPGRLEALIHAGELLPDWSDQWVIVDRERCHQLRLHALERLSKQLVAIGRYGLAVDTCLAALAAEPLRESAQRQLIEVYLREGNRAEALRQYATYQRVIREEVGVEPSPEITDLVRTLTTSGIGN